MNLDAVALGSIAAVAISAVIVVFLVFKIKTLMDKDAENRKQ